MGKPMLLQPKLLNVDRTPHRPTKRRKKITLVFDEGKRREFLQGFRKRKLQRQQRAKEELQKQLKEEKKRIKREARELYEKLLSSRDVPQIQQQRREEEQVLAENFYETEEHTVNIVELNMQDLSRKNALMGDNNNNEEESGSSAAEDETSDRLESRHGEEIVGMSAAAAPPPLSEREKRRSRSTSGAEAKSENHTHGRVTTTTTTTTKYKNGTDVKREIKRTAWRRVKDSKAFRLKQKLERNKNRKESLRTRKRIEKMQRKRKGKK